MFILCSSLKKNKNIKTNKFLSSILILVGLGFSFSSKAQCTFTITNNTNCNFDVEVHYAGGSTGVFTIGPGVTGVGTTCTITGFDVYDAGALFGNAYTTAANPTGNLGGCTKAQVYFVVLAVAARTGVIN